MLSPRTCGSCTMCCKLMGIVELKKPTGTWCPHVAVGKGCQIYADRPPSCREFACTWLQGLGADTARPDHTKCVMFTPLAAPTALCVTVDTATPDAWQHGETARLVRHWLQGPTHTVIVTCGTHSQILGNDPAEVQRMQGLVKSHAPA